MRTLAIDIETYSSYDLGTCGVHRYVEAPDFEVLLFAYAFDDGPVEAVDLASGEELPGAVLQALADPEVSKTAFNAAFEMTCLGRIGLPVHPEQWYCTMVQSAMLGLPLSLDMAGKVLGTGEQKMSEGKALIRYFSIPCKPTKTNGGRTRNLPEHAPDKWATFKVYCMQDVATERAIRDRLGFFTPTDKERRLWLIDQEINRRGVLIDRTLVNSAIRLDVLSKDRLSAEAALLTGLDNPNSVTQLRGWLSEQTGKAVDTLQKGDIPSLMRETDNEAARRALAIRLEMAKTSVKKYEAMDRAACDDVRVRGLVQYYGANRTGRWAGRLVQVQNLPQNHLDDLDAAREAVKSGSFDLIEALYGNVPDTLSQLIRTAFVAKPGHTFAVADFSAIEARVIAWLAREEWRLDVFRTHGKIYEASAALMYKVSVASIHKGSPERQKGKIAELALGYQGGVGALKTMGGERMGLTDDEMTEIVNHWRAASPRIVRLWYDVQTAAIQAVKTGETVRLRNLLFGKDHGSLFIQLPSGRRLYYMRPRLAANKWGGESLSYEGLNQTTKKWERTETYGGKLVENIVQGTARDCLAEAMLGCADAGINIVFHVHDEVIAEVPEEGSDETLARVLDVFRAPIAWAPGLPLKGDGYITKYYKKD